MFWYKFVAETDNGFTISLSLSCLPLLLLGKHTISMLFNIDIIVVKYRIFLEFVIYVSLSSLEFPMLFSFSFSLSLFVYFRLSFSFIVLKYLIWISIPSLMRDCNNSFLLLVKLFTRISLYSWINKFCFVFVCVCFFFTFLFVS